MQRRALRSTFTGVGAADARPAAAESTPATAASSPKSTRLLRFAFFTIVPLAGVRGFSFTFTSDGSDTADAVRSGRGIIRPAGDRGNRRGPADRPGKYSPRRVIGHTAAN